MAKNLVDIGMSQAELREQIITRTVDRLVEDIHGEDYDNRVMQAVQKAANDAISAYCDNVIRPLVEQKIDAITFQQTNQWGEKQGKKLTFREYLIDRAEKWLQETVNYEGKPRGADSYGWNGTTTRIAYMVDKHLHFEIENAMKKALTTANQAIVGGINEAVKMKLSEVVAGLQVSVKTK